MNDNNAPDQKPHVLPIDALVILLAAGALMWITIIATVAITLAVFG